jgi:hypothetical protein
MEAENLLNLTKGENIEVGNITERPNIKYLG